MIDDIRKAFVCRGCEAVYSDSPVSSCDCLNGAGFDEHYIVDDEIIRNARRYLALRERFITEWLCNHDYGPGKELESSSARLHLDIPSTTAGIGVPPTSPVDAIVIDAAADRLLEGGE